MQDQQHGDEPGRTAAKTSPIPQRPFGGKGRSIVALLLVIIGVLLAPAAVLASWTRMELVDTDSFVQTLAPLAQRPEVQEFIADQAVQAVEQSVDIDELVGEFFAGITEMGLPSRAEATLPLLEMSVAQGVRSLISTAADQVVASRQFAVLWEQTLRQTHSRAIAVIQGDPKAVLQLTDDGMIAIDLNVVIGGIRQHLAQQGLGFAEFIPEVSRSVPIVASGSLVQIRLVYQAAVAAGYWLPWVTIGLLVAGVAMARNRLRALSWTGVGLTASLLLLAAALGIVRQFFIVMVSPSTMPSTTAVAVFDQLTMLISSALLALIALSLIVAIGAWLAGSSPSARLVRERSDKTFAGLRRAADQHDIGTGAFGRLVERWYSALLAGTVVIGLLVLFSARPIRFGVVVTTLVVMLIVLLALQLVRRPEPATEPESRP